MSTAPYTALQHTCTFVFVKIRKPISNCHLLQKSDFKLLFVAVILIVLRVWDLPFLTVRYYPSAAKALNHSHWATVLIVLEVRNSNQLSHLSFDRPKLGMCVLAIPPK